MTSVEGDGGDDSTQKMQKDEGPGDEALGAVRGESSMASGWTKGDQALGAVRGESSMASGWTKGPGDEALGAVRGESSMASGWTKGPGDEALGAVRGESSMASGWTKGDQALGAVRGESSMASGWTKGDQALGAVRGESSMASGWTKGDQALGAVRGESSMASGWTKGPGDQALGAVRGESSMASGWTKGDQALGAVRGESSMASGWTKGDQALGAVRGESSMASGWTKGDQALGAVRGESSMASGWTKVSCPCCESDQVEPLVLVQLGGFVQEGTKKWLIKLIEASAKEGGAALLAHPGEDAGGDIMVVSAPRCTLLRATEELGLCKTHRSGDMAAFSCHDRDNFKDTDDLQVFLTLAERQYIVKYELEGLRAQRDLRIPGLSDRLTLQHRDGIWQKLQQTGVIVDVFPLHDQDKLKALRKAWYTSNQLAQPLDAVQAYFGGNVAFYFSFLDFYTWSLLPPAILGLALTYFSAGVQKEALESLSGSGQSSSDDDDSASLSVSGHMIQAVFSMLWSTVVMEMWKRRSSSLSYRWGSGHLAERFTEPRPGFHGQLGVNPVTGRVEPLFPDWQRQLRVTLGSLPVVLLFLGLVVLGMLGFYWGEAQAQGLHREWDSLLSQVLLYVPSITHIVYTNILGNVYRHVALSLTEWENHREESVFQNHHTAKVLLFTFFNSFAVLFHIAFYKQDLPLLRKRLASLLIITQLVNQVTEVVIPFLVDLLISAPRRSEHDDDPQEDKLRNQGKLPAFPGLFAEYIELLVQFGYLSLFSCVYPLTAMLLLINNLTEIRSDAYKICNLFRKPFSAPVTGMGVWQTAFEILSFVSVISNCWLLLLSPQLREFCQDGGISGTNIVLLAVLLEHVLILIKMVLVFLIPDEPAWVRIQRQKIEFKSMLALREQL